MIYNQQRSKIKKYLIELIKKLKESSLIEVNYKIIFDDKYYFIIIIYPIILDYIRKN